MKKSCSNFFENVVVGLLSPLSLLVFAAAYYVCGGNLIGAAISTVFVFCVTELIFYKRGSYEQEQEQEQENTSVNFR